MIGLLARDVFHSYFISSVSLKSWRPPKKRRSEKDGFSSRSI